MRPDDVLDLGRDLGTADRKRPVVATSRRGSVMPDVGALIRVRLTAQ